jgi:hypothetical protein
VGNYKRKKGKKREKKDIYGGIDIEGERNGKGRNGESRQPTSGFLGLREGE